MAVVCARVNFAIVLLLVIALGRQCCAFVIPQRATPIVTSATSGLVIHQHRHPSLFTNFARHKLRHAATLDEVDLEPQVLATGYSQQMDLIEAIREAMEMALQALPTPQENSKIDLALISISSLYDGSSSPATVVPTCLEMASSYGDGIQHLVGSSVGGIVSSTINLDEQQQQQQQSSEGEDEEDEEDNENDDEEDEKKEKIRRACTPVELEGIPAVSVMLLILPDVRIKTFHVLGLDVPDDYGRLPPKMWKRSVGLDGYVEEEGGDTAFYLVPSPAFQNELDDLMRGLDTNFPGSTTFGAIASTVSSLSRARLFRYDVNDENGIQTLADGCVGVAMSGDIKVETMIAQGAKPVGGIYRIVKGEESTIQAIALDEAATEQLQEDEEESIDDDGVDDVGSDQKTNQQALNAQIQAAYAKAIIPKPVLAEANFLMRTLSDDDQAFMRKALLIGLERGGSVGRTPSELARLAEGNGHRFRVHQVASAAMKDGSVTLTLGSVEIEPGTRLRFFVRESAFAKKEVEALWMGHKRRTFDKTLEGQTTFTPTGCFLFPTLDRGSRFFLGKPGFESDAASQYLPTVPCMSGFFSNGVIGKLDGNDGATDGAGHVHGSASGYVLFGSKSGRPLFSPADAAKEKALKEEQKALFDLEEKVLAAEDAKRQQRAKKSTVDFVKKAPRDEDGELILKRREVHSGRALTVSTVEWSVAEKTATPTSALEGFMWDKETEVDRFRERVPLANLVSQCRISAADPTRPKPRDWVGPVKDAAKNGKFVIIPECKRMEPVSGSLRKRYDLSKLVKEFTSAGVPALSVNCDGVMFGGSLEDITKARDASSKAALALQSEDDDGVIVPPILASDLLLYPYQLYKMRLAGADAVNLIVGALATKDLVYLTKIASSLQLQLMVTVTSETQVKNLSVISAGAINGMIVSNRHLEDFSFDMTGEQALKLLRSEELNEFRGKHGDDIPILVEGRVGIIEQNGSPIDYLEALKDAGAIGAVVGGGLVESSEEGGVAGVSPLESLLQAS